MKDTTYYKNLLPERITVITKETEDGLIAEIKEFPHCYTQAKNIPELIEMVNDAIFTYLEIPGKIVDKLGIMYLPEKISKELKQINIQEFCNELEKEVIVSPLQYTKVLVS